MTAFRAAAFPRLPAERNEMRIAFKRGAQGFAVASALRRDDNEVAGRDIDIRKIVPAGPHISGPGITVTARRRGVDRAVSHRPQKRQERNRHR